MACHEQRRNSWRAAACGETAGSRRLGFACWLSVSDLEGLYRALAVRGFYTALPWCDETNISAIIEAWPRSGVAGTVIALGKTDVQALDAKGQ